MLAMKNLQWKLNGAKKLTVKAPCHSLFPLKFNLTQSPQIFNFLYLDKTRLSIQFVKKIKIIQKVS